MKLTRSDGCSEASKCKGKREWEGERSGHPYLATACPLREESVVSAQILTSPLITTEASEAPVIF